jgi:fibronectin-binding autotransporter adhesin
LESASSLGLTFSGTGTGTITVSGTITSFDNTSNVVSSSGQTNGNAGQLRKAGTYTLSLTGSNTYQGVTSITGGSLLVNNGTSGSATGTGTLSVATGANLGGSGQIGGAVTIQTGASVSPGNSPGTLTLNNGLSVATAANYSWELAAVSTASPGTNYDQIVISGGNLAINSGASVTLNFIGVPVNPNSGDAFWNTAHTWTLIDINGTATNTGSTNFGSITNATFTSGTFSLGLSSGDVLLNFAPVPEPLTLILLGAVGLMFYNRKRLVLA